MGDETLEIEIEARINEKNSAGSARVRTLSTSERVKNAGRQLGMYWGIAVFCVLLPLLHFILVPFFLLLGIFLSARAGSSSQIIVDGSVLCPECKKPFLVKPELVRWPLREVCQNCSWSLTIAPCSAKS